MTHALLAGNIVEDPDWLPPLRREMHAAWLAQLTNEELGLYPKFAMQRYFLDGSGQPNSSNAAQMGVMIVDFDHGNTQAVDDLCSAANAVAGLQIHVDRGPLSVIVCMGWSKAETTHMASRWLRLEREEQATAAAEGRNVDMRYVRARYLSGYAGQGLDVTAAAFGLHTLPINVENFQQAVPERLQSFRRDPDIRRLSGPTLPGWPVVRTTGASSSGAFSLLALPRNSENFQQAGPEGLQLLRLDPDIRHLSGPALSGWQGAAAGLRTTNLGAAHWGGGFAEQHGPRRPPQAKFIDHGPRVGTAALDTQDALHCSGDPQQTGRMEFGEP